VYVLDPDEYDTIEIGDPLSRGAVAIAVPFTLNPELSNVVAILFVCVDDY
jgi:hypothetical protein